MERVRAQEEAVEATGRIASELAVLRDDLRTQMNTGMRREFERLRQELGDIIVQAQENGRSDAFISELERLSDAVTGLGPRGDERTINMLRLEVEQLRSALDDLAKEETVRSVDRHWSKMDHRLDEFAERFERQDHPGMEAFAERLDQIGRAVAALPESMSVRTLEDRVHSLSDAVAHFAARQDSVSADTIALMESRLDEISQAIVAATAQPPHVDPEPFHRIEARIAALARQIDEVGESGAAREMADRVDLLSDKVDMIAQRIDLPEQVMDHLADQLAVITRKLDHEIAARPTTDAIMDGLETRFATLSEILDRRQSDVIERSNALFRDLEGRLADVADRMDRRDAAMPEAETEMLAAIDARFAEISRRLERTETPDDAAIRGLEMRLDDIAAQLQQSNAAIAQVDPDLVRNLEGQVATLSRHLDQPSAALPDFEDIAPRLDQIERSIEENREAIIEAARRAAEEAVNDYPGAEGDSLAVAGLAGDLKSLEALTRKADERNTRTFEAIHDTLLKIVDRLGSLESDERPAPDRAKRMDVGAPSLEPDHGIDIELPAAPAMASAASAVAPVKADKRAAPVAESRRSLLGGISRAISGLKEREKATPKPVVQAAPRTKARENLSDAKDRIDPKLANQPLEPGSGTPDLNAIMRRVRDEAQPRDAHEADTAKADFIAAARRAAQAAAAEAEMLKKKTGDRKGGSGAAGVGGFLKNRSRPVMIAAAAILIAIAGMQLSNAFFRSGEKAGPQLAASMALPQTDAAETDRPDEGDVFDSLDRSGDVAEDQIAADPQEATDSVIEDEAAAPATQTATEPAPAEPASMTASLPAAPDVATPSEIPLEAGPVALREAAAANDAKALFEIGSRYAEGRGVKTDMARAAGWYERAAGLGLAPAQYRIGNFYEKGTGVARDIARAKGWYEKAAAQGNASAMHNLAVLYAMGADGVTDNEKAAKWFLDAAELGVKDSQFNLGILSAKGVGIPQNLEESYKWFALVAQAGDRDAEAKRDEIANALLPEQLEKARALTRLWKPKPVDAAANEVVVPPEWTESDGNTASIDMKKAVTNIQAILNKNGYDAGSADGVMGDKTRAAIVKFQKDNGMDATGEVNEPLVRALLARK
jgi:localization factor PodJL